MEEAEYSASFAHLIKPVDNYGNKRYTEYDGEGNVVKYAITTHPQGGLLPKIRYSMG